MHNSSFSDVPYHFHQKETNTILLDFNFNIQLLQLYLLQW